MAATGGDLSRSAAARCLEHWLVGAELVLDSGMTNVLAWAPMSASSAATKEFPAEQSEVAGEIVEAVAAVSGQAAAGGDVLGATLAELDRRYATASEVAERAVAHQRIVGAARDVVKSRAAAALNGQSASRALNDEHSADTIHGERAATRDDVSGGQGRETRQSAQAVPAPPRHPADDRTTDRRPAEDGQAGDSTHTGVLAPASWPTGPRSGVDLHKRSNYGRIIGCVGEGLQRQAAVRDALGLKQNATQMAMTKLISDGYLNKDDDGRYTLTDKGRRAYDELTAMFADKSKEAATV